MKMLAVSTKQLRQDFGKVVEILENGQSLLLLYRSRPLAEIKPILTEPLRPRRFAQGRVREWLKDDRLNRKELSRIDEIIERLP